MILYLILALFLIVSILFTHLVISSDLKENHSLAHYQFLQNTSERDSKSFTAWLNKEESKYSFSQDNLILCIIASAILFFVALFLASSFYWITGITFPYFPSGYYTLVAFICYVLAASITTLVITQKHFKNLKNSLLAWAHEGICNLPSLVNFKKPAFLMLQVQFT